MDILDAAKLLPANPTKHEDSRNSKKIQGVHKTFGFPLNFFNLPALLDLLVKAKLGFQCVYMYSEMKV